MLGLDDSAWVERNLEQSLQYVETRMLRL